MNRTRFTLYMRAVDDSFLEEAQRSLPNRKQRVLRWLLPKVVCLCLLLIGLFIWQPWKDMENAVTKEDMTAQGYFFEAPDGADNVAYSFAALENDVSVQVAQMEFTRSNAAYTCRALHREKPCNITGLNADEDTFKWNSRDYQMQLCVLENNLAWISWYSAGDHVQYSLSAQDGKAALLDTAVSLLREMDHNMALAPEAAVNVKFDVFTENGLTVTETGFISDFVQYTYRTAATDATSSPAADISGMGDYAVKAETQIQHCDAYLSYEEGGAGKIIWFDAVLGQLHSLYMDDDASEEALLQMAQVLFTGAQKND